MSALNESLERLERLCADHRAGAGYTSFSPSLVEALIQVARAGILVERYRAGSECSLCGWYQQAPEDKHESCPGADLRVALERLEDVAR